MHWQFTPYSIPLLITALISITLALYAWQRRGATPAAISFAVLMAALAEWSLGYVLELGSTDLPTILFWAKIEYLGIASSSLAWLVFALQFANQDRWLTRRNLALAALGPAITQLVVWTNPAHGLMWRQTALDTSGPFPALAVSYGPWFWVHSAYSYLFLLLGTILLIRIALNFPRVYRFQAGLMLLAVLAPWVSNGLYLTGLAPVPHLDLTPFAFSLTGLAAAWSLFRFHLLELVPVARQAIIDGMVDGVIVLDAQNRIVDINPAAQQMIGQSATAVIGQLAGQALAPWADLVERYRDVFETSSEIVTGEGETQRYFDLRISPLHDRHDRLTGRLIVVRDITTRKQAAEALRQSEQRFRQVVNSISDHIYMTEVTPMGQSLNLYVSPHVEVLTGYPLEKFNDWSFWPTVVIHPDDRAAAAEQAARLAGGQASQVEYRLVRADGQIIWVRDSGRAEKDPVRQRIVIYGVVSDITQRKRAEAELALARDQALEASRLKGELLAKVSHELRTPLGAILGYAELLHTGIYGDLSTQQKQATVQIIESTNSLTGLVNELLDQAQFEEGRVKLQIAPFDLAEMVQGVDTKMQTLAQAKGLDLITRIDPQMPAIIQGDEKRLRQILANLVGNAIKFTSSGTIRVSLYPDQPNRWVIQVADTGPGIPPEARAYIFEPFRQVDGSATRKYGGTGLGLTIVKQLIALMDGDISLESEEGCGSTFTVSLPLI